ncbi:MAG: NADH-quinone oxidoreductase subunit C [Verrucomicrobia bacterium]|nr:NADH-quinone oxidoreductase subunit C [Verrucomicrobiota bacterium]
MSSSIEQLAKEFAPLAVKEMVQLPPALVPKPAPAPKPAAAPAAAKPAAVPADPSVVGRVIPNPPSVAPTPAPKPAVAAAPKPAPAPAAPPPPPPKPVQIWKFEDKGLHLEVTVEPANVVAAAEIMDRHGFAIDAVTGMDWPTQGLLEVIYDFLHFQTGERVAYRARIARNDPKIATISKVFPGADWHERETHDFFGINFVGHRDLSPFMLPDDATYHPLLKDFKA